jgi:competence protein ComEA
MKPHYISAALTAAVLLLSASLSFALENKADAPQETASKAKASPGSAIEIDARSKAAAQIKLVNINSASSKELKKLPGISDAEAAKIIAGRPYGSKAWLVTHNIIDKEVYENLKKLIVAGQPYKAGAKNAAIHDKK